MRNSQSQITKKNHASNTLIDSSLNLDRVFNGNYWDDFVLPLFSRKDVSASLMLGVGFGAGLRALLASKPELEITGVDIDSCSNQKCQDLFSHEFNYHPHLLDMDATKYLQTTQETFDLIWVDLYDSNGPVHELFELSFWRLIKDRLTPQGLLAINIYGIANHLEPFLSVTPLKYLYSLLRIEFSQILSFPHRRNTTLIASNAPFESIELVSPETLNQFDQVTLHLQAQRVHKLISFNYQIDECDVEQHPGFSFHCLNELQQKGWGNFLYELNHVPDLGIQFTSPRSLVSYLQNPGSGAFLIDTLVKYRSSLLVMVPTFLGADIHNHNEPLDWYFDYLNANGPGIANELPELWQSYFLPQWMSMYNTRPALRNEENLQKISKYVGAHK